MVAGNFLHPGKRHEIQPAEYHFLRIIPEFPRINAEHEPVRENIKIREPGMPSVRLIAEIRSREYSGSAHENAARDNCRHQLLQLPGDAGAEIQQYIHRAEHAYAEKRDHRGNDYSFQPTAVFRRIRMKKVLYAATSPLL